MSGTRRASPERRDPSGGDPWEPRLVAEARRLTRSRGSGPLSSAELDAAARDLLNLQRGLTGERGLIGAAYMDERSRLASYLLFYWSVSRAQVRGLLSMAFADTGPRPPTAPLRILDLGSGPAPCAIAAAEWLGAPDAAIVACDRSELALESGRRLAEAQGYAFRAVPRWDATGSAPPDGQFDLIILGHLLNELWKDRSDRVALRHAFVRGLRDRLAGNGLLLILEPATLAASRDMSALRDLIAADGLRVRAPCLRRGPCPALEKEGQSCHSDFSWRMNRTVGELSRRTGLDKGLVKTAGFVFASGGCGAGGGPPPPRGGAASVGGAASADGAASAGPAPGASASADGSPADGARYRVVSEPMLNKAGRLRLLVCGEDGRFPLSAKNGEGHPAEAVFRSLKRSDRIELSGAERREGGLGLCAETRIARLAPDAS